MKFYLVKNELLPRKPTKEVHEQFQKSLSWEASVQSGSVTEFGDIIPLHDTEVEREKCAKLKSLLVQHCHPYQAASATPPDRIWYLVLRIGLSNIRNENGTHLKGFIQLYGVFPESCLHGIRELSDNDATIQIEYQLLDEGAEPIEGMPSMFTKEIKISDNAEMGIASCKDTEMQFPANHFENWESFMHGIWTITVTIPDEVLEGNYSSPNRLQTIAPRTTRQILEEEILSDVTLLATSGAKIKAHKVFLACQSSVFHGLFSKTEVAEVEMGNMSEESVRAFLRYLYYEDLSVKEGRMEQIYELYRVAHMYRVENLEMLMRDTILAQPNDWFELDTSVKLFAFARQVNAVDVELKVVQILKTFTKSLTESESYQDLFQTNSAAAMELCKLALCSK